jgi:hypothetical protein
MQGAIMKKPMTMPEERQPRNVVRADLVINEGFGLEVDGRLKMVFPALDAAQERARNLKKQYPMLQVKIFDAVKQKRTLVELEPIPTVK